MVDTTPSLQGLGMGQSTKVTIQISACFKKVNCFENHRTANSTPFSQKLLPCLASTGKHSFYAQQLGPKCSKLHPVHQGFANAQQLSPKCSKLHPVYQGFANAQQLSRKCSKLHPVHHRFANAQQLCPKCSKLHPVHQGFANAQQKCSIQIQTHIRAEDVHH